ncbi:MAG: hypothetical protein V1712_01975 [Patescibacteria group bacterium]
MSINLITEPETNLGNKLLAWQFPEFREIERSRLWWIVALVILVVLLVYAIRDFNFLFAIIVIIGAAIIWVDSRKKPALLDFAIHQQGVAVGRRFWLWNELDFFWIAYRPPEITSLYLQPKAALKPRLSIPLVNINPLKIREILTKFLREDLEREDEPTSEALSRLLKIQ